MLKAIFHRFLGAGTLPAPIRSALEAEGIDVLEEKIRATITFRNYKAPGRRSSWRREWFAGTLALTARRILAYRGAQPLVDIPYDHPTIKQVRFALEKQDCLCISFEASTFHADRSGMIEVRFFTPQAPSIVTRIHQRRTEIA